VLLVQYKVYKKNWNMGPQKSAGWVSDYWR